MTVYEHRATVTAVAGATASTTLSIPGGRIGQVLIRANTDTTVFRADLTDANGLARRHYGYATHEINDTTLDLPWAGPCTLNITNASPNDTFSILFAVAEGR